MQKKLGIDRCQVSSIIELHTKLKQKLEFFVYSYEACMSKS